jgi:lipopolysaccharide export LptBFGC system permease protein LptF
MQELFERELDQHAGRGRLLLSAAALAGIADVVGRGLHERVSEERRNFIEGDRVFLRQVAVAFVAALVTLETVFLLLGSRTRNIAGDRGLEILLFSVPFVAAMTIPMAMFVAALWSTRRARFDSRRLPSETGAGRPARVRLTPLVGFAALVAVLSLAVNTQLIPRANARLQVLYAGTVNVPRSDRSMTVQELRAAARQIEAERQAPGNRAALERVAGYQVEIQKKFALAAASIFLTLLAVGITRRFASSGPSLLGVASAAVFTGYYVALMAGEHLAEQLVLSPVLAMWSGNLLVLVLAVLALKSSASGEESSPLPAQ